MDVLATGYPSIDHILRVSHSPTVGETARLLALPDSSYSFGGCGANVAVALARLGFASGVAMVMGDDEQAGAYLCYLSQLGINTDHCLCLPGQRTSHSFMYMNPDGQYQNFFFPGAADAWQGTLALKDIAAYQFAVVTVGQRDYNYQFIQRTAEANVPLLWVMKPDIYAYPADLLDAFLARSRYVILNHIEADYVLKALGRARLSDLFAGAFADTLQAVVVTRGAQGVTVQTASDAVDIPATVPSAVIDSTGAGDGFAGGFLAGLLRGASPVVSAQLGTVVASFVLEAVGCQTNLPTWEHAMARYAAHFGHFEGGA